MAKRMAMDEEQKEAFTKAAETLSELFDMSIIIVRDTNCKWEWESDGDTIVINRVVMELNDHLNGDYE